MGSREQEQELGTREEAAAVSGAEMGDQVGGRLGVLLRRRINGACRRGRGGRSQRCSGSGAAVGSGVGTGGVGHNEECTSGEMPIRCPLRWSGAGREAPQVGLRAAVGAEDTGPRVGVPRVFRGQM